MSVPTGGTAAVITVPEGVVAGAEAGTGAGLFVGTGLDAGVALWKGGLGDKLSRGLRNALYVAGALSGFLLGEPTPPPGPPDHPDDEPVSESPPSARGQVVPIRHETNKQSASDRWVNNECVIPGAQTPP